MLKKPTVAIDTYVSDPELVVNVGTDDFDGAISLESIGQIMDSGKHCF